MIWFWLIIGLWTFFGFLCIGPAIEMLDKERPKTTKKQWAFAFFLLGPIGWLLGIGALCIKGIEKFWNVLGK
jgi:hypothetical protein